MLAAWAVAEELNRRLYDTLQQTAINAFGSVRQRWPRTCWIWRPRSSVRSGPAGGTCRAELADVGPARGRVCGPAGVPSGGVSGDGTRQRGDPWRRGSMANPELSRHVTLVTQPRYRGHRQAPARSARWLCSLIEIRPARALMTEATMATFQNTLTIQRPVDNVFAFSTSRTSRPGTT